MDGIEIVAVVVSEVTAFSVGEIIFGKRGFIVHMG